MNLKTFFLAMGAGAVGLSTHAALLNLGQYESGPYYSDFSTYGLDVNYAYTGNSSSGTGVFTVSDEYSGGSLAVAGETYTGGSQAPGTQGKDNGNFSGSYSLTADISYNNGVATLTSGTFDIYGALMGGTASSLLLSGNLETGAGSVAFGYVDHTATMTSGEYNQFDFLINLGSLTGNSQIVRDFLQSMGGTGGIILEAGFDYGHTGILNGKPGIVYNANNDSTATTANVTYSTYQGFDGYWDQSFANQAGLGQANTFVPEPAAYPWGASIAALMACACSARRAWPFAQRQSKG